VPIQKTSCVYRGNTFFCEFSIAGTGVAREVRIRYNGEELKARTHDNAPELVAQTLLRELVVLEAIAIKVAEASQQGVTAALRTDARERRAAA
jgi:hypothetical protein